MATSLDEIFALAAAAGTIIPEPDEVDFTRHEWKSTYEGGLKYSSDKLEFHCEKCGRKMTLETEQTMEEALKANSIEDNCGLEVISDVHSR